MNYIQQQEKYFCGLPQIHLILAIQAHLEYVVSFNLKLLPISASSAFPIEQQLKSIKKHRHPVVGANGLTLLDDLLFGHMIKLIIGKG